MSSFLICCQLSGLTLKRNDALRLVLINDDDVVAFTPVEYRLFSILLDLGMVEDRKLIEEALTINAANKSAQKNLEKHIDNMRFKIRHTRLRICRLSKYGYVLVAASESSERAMVTAAAS